MKSDHVENARLRLRPSHLVKILAAVLLTAGGISLADRCLAAEVSNAVGPLRVGITPEYPPLVFREPDGTNGLEIDLAKAMGQELGRPVEFVVLRRDEQIPALLGGQTDIIMSGMSVTKTRQFRVSFSNPYLKSELRAIFVRKNASHYSTVDQVQKSKERIGVVPGTTAELFVKQNCPDAQIVPILMRRDVPFFLIKGNRMDLFVDDSYALADMLSRNEADLDYLKPALNKEDLAWAMRPSDTELQNKVNAILDRWKTNGTLERAVNRWMPYLKNIRPADTAAQGTSASQ